MSILTKAIVDHDMLAIAKAMQEQPELAWERNQDCLPIELASRSGNIFTYARLNRLLGQAAIGVDAAQLLKDYLIALSKTNYFGPVDPSKAAFRAW